VSRHQKGKTNLDLLEQEIVSGSGISWAICKSAPHPRYNHASTHHSFFYGPDAFLPPNQQRQSTEGKFIACKNVENTVSVYVDGNELKDHLRV